MQFQWALTVVIAVARLLRWLQDGGHAIISTTRPPSNWESRLLVDWQQITGDDTAGEVNRPRYSEEEVGRLFMALDSVDPRFRFACLLAAENRLGPLVTRTRRSHLDLRTDEGFPFGRLTIPGRGNKGAVRIAFDAEARAEVDAVLTHGYLRRLEDLYVAGIYDDYTLFPGGSLPGGVADLTETRPMNDRTLNDHWHRLEDAAGIQHVHGRGAYGLRRRSADLARRVEPDTTILD